MNILASYNWLKDYLKTKATPVELARELSLRSSSVEEMIDLAARYDHVVIGVVKGLEAHPKADRLRLVQTDLGARGVLTIVCGGTNVAVGQKVVVAMPGARVRWHGEGDLITLAPAVIRGVESAGMICAPGEIGFDKVACGAGEIWDITDLCEAKAGTSFAEAFDLNDTLYDIEVTTNRSDAMSIIGLAREASACDLGEFTWMASELPKPRKDKNLQLKVRVEEGKVCPRYMAVVMDGIKVGPSPMWLQTRLLLSGHRPINNVVDITNYILHEYGQPLHAFDYDALGTGEIVVRAARAGETLKTLDGNEYKLQSRNLVITDGQNPVAIAGVMGGEKSGTWDTTKRIVIEAATFDAMSVRRTARDLNLYSDAQSMYEKSLSTESLPPALARAIELVAELAGGEVASDIVDIQAEKYQPKTFGLNPDTVNKAIGVVIPAKNQVKILENLGFTVEKNETEVRKVTVPYWRDHDIEADVDLVEEIARIFGYHNIPSQLPSGRLPQVVRDPELFWEEKIKDELCLLGYTEFFGVSIVSDSQLEKFGLKADDAVKIHNPLTADLTHMRTSLLPSLLTSVEENQAHHKSGQVFELARVYKKVAGDLPQELSELVIARFGYEDAVVAYRSLRGALEAVLAKAGVTVTFEDGGAGENYHPTRSARIGVNGKKCGEIGEVAAKYTKAFGVDLPVFVVRIALTEIVHDFKVTRKYLPEPAYPGVRRDIALLVDKMTTFGDLQSAVLAVDSLVRRVDFVEEYSGQGIPEGKMSVTISLDLRSDSETLTGEKVEEIMGRVTAELIKKFEAQIR